MKHILILAFVCLSFFTALAQSTPQGIAYQAVAVKDGSYAVAGPNREAIYWSNKDIKVRFTILEQYPNGTSQYSEVHETATDEFGVFNVVIGTGTVISGSFRDIPWELGTAHLKVEIDFNNSDSYKLTSIERFWSVPYAFMTNESKSGNTDSAFDALNDKIEYLKNRDKDTVIGNEGITYKALDSLNQVLRDEIAALRSGDKDTVIGNELQTLSIAGDSLSISDGNTVRLEFPVNLDNDPNNEIQTLSIAGDSLSILDGNTVKLDFPINLDNDTTNEIQTISLNNDTIRLNNGGGNIPLESIKSYVNSSSNSSGKNGTVDDMWFGVRPEQKTDEPMLYLDADTVYVLGLTNRATPYVIKLFPDGTRDTLIRINRSASTVNNFLVSLPFLYHDKDIYHIDTGFIRVANSTFAVGSPRVLADRFHNLIYLDRGGYSYKVGNINYYNFNKDTTYIITNPDYDYRGLTTPQIINDSSMLIAPRIWKTSQDTLTPTGQVIDFYNSNNNAGGFFVPIVINDYQILYEKQIYQSTGSGSSWKTILKLYDMENASSKIIEGRYGRGSSRMFNFIGISNDKLLYWLDFNPTQTTGGTPLYYYWFDIKGNYSTRFIPYDFTINIQIENRCKYRRISLWSGSNSSSSGFTYYSFPNVNYTKPTSGRTYLHE